MDDFENILEALVQPLGLIWAFSIGACALAVLKRRWGSAVAFGLVAVVLFVFGSTQLPHLLLATLERPYAARANWGEADAEKTLRAILSRNRVSDGSDSVRPEEIRAVVMLGGMGSRSSNDLLGINVAEAFDRVLTAIEVTRIVRDHGTDMPLVLGGGGNRRIGWSESETLMRWMSGLGMATNHVQILPPLGNTFEEAQHVRHLLQHPSARAAVGKGLDSRETSSASGAELESRTAISNTGGPVVILVTSAYHMKRSQAVFEKAGLTVIPVASDFVGLAGIEAKRPFNPAPRPFGFVHTWVYVHEVVGWWVYRWRGWV